MTESDPKAVMGAPPPQRDPFWPFIRLKRLGTTGFKTRVAIVATGAVRPRRPASVSRAIGERSDKHSVPEILKPGQNQPLYNSKDNCG
jgi:hypothetical protein